MKSEKQKRENKKYLPGEILQYWGHRKNMIIFIGQTSNISFISWGYWQIIERCGEI